MCLYMDSCIVQHLRSHLTGMSRSGLPCAAGAGQDEGSCLLSLSLDAVACCGCQAFKPCEDTSCLPVKGRQCVTKQQVHRLPMR